MSENNHVDMEVKKPDVANNELMVEMKAGPSSVVIPSKPSEEAKVDVVEERISSSITNSEVGIGGILLSIVCNYHYEECNRNRLFRNSLFDCSSGFFYPWSYLDRYYSFLDRFFPCDNC